MSDKRDSEGVIHETTTEARGASGVKTNFHVLGIGLVLVVAIFALIFFLGSA